MGKRTQRGWANVNERGRVNVTRAGGRERANESGEWERGNESRGTGAGKRERGRVSNGSSSNCGSPLPLFI